MSDKETGLSAEMKRRSCRNYFASVCEHDWVCVRVCLSKLFTHSLGQKFCQSVLCGNVCFYEKEYRSCF